MCKNKLAARIHFSHDTANKHLSGVAQMSQYSSPELCKLINGAHCTLVAWLVASIISPTAESIQEASVQFQICRHEKEKRRLTACGELCWASGHLNVQNISEMYNAQPFLFLRQSSVNGWSPTCCSSSPSTAIALTHGLRQLTCQCFKATNFQTNKLHTNYAHGYSYMLYTIQRISWMWKLRKSKYRKERTKVTDKIRVRWFQKVACSKLRVKLCELEKRSQCPEGSESREPFQ